MQEGFNLLRTEFLLALLLLPLCEVVSCAKEAHAPDLKPSLLSVMAAVAGARAEAEAGGGGRGRAAAE